MRRHQPAPTDQAAQKVLSLAFGSSVVGDQGRQSLPATLGQHVTVPGRVGYKEDPTLLGFTKQTILPQGVARQGHGQHRTVAKEVSASNRTILNLGKLFEPACSGCQVCRHQAAAPAMPKICSGHGPLVAST